MQVSPADEKMIAEVKKRDFSLIMDDKGQYHEAKGVAAALANCIAVPAHYRGKPNDVLIALYMAAKMEEEPFEFMMGTSIQKGRLDFNGKYAISLAHRRGILDSRISFKTVKTEDDIRVTAMAKYKGEVITAEATLKQALAARWGANSREHNLYRQIPEHMLHFRAAKFLLNRHCPEVFSAKLPSKKVEADKPDHIDAVIVEDADGISK